MVQSRARIPWELQGTLTFPWLLLRGGGSGGLGGGVPWLCAHAGISIHDLTALFHQIWCAELASSGGAGHNLAQQVGMVFNQCQNEKAVGDIRHGGVPSPVLGGCSVAVM